MIKRFIVGFLLLAIIGLSVYSWWRFRDRHPGYDIDLLLTTEEKSAIEAGFGKASINPTYFESWTDVNQDARYKPEDGDTFDDENGNGRFDAIWIAGFHNKRPAQGIHDTLWARSAVIQQGNVKIGLCVIDAIGFGSDDIIDIRKNIQNELGLDYLTISSTHSHETPDLIGMWGGSEFRSGVSPDYLERVKAQCANSLREADQNRTVARITYAEDPVGAVHLVEDSRKPVVLDPVLRVIRFTEVGSDRPIGSLIGWSNHPETLWSDNLLLSADFPHYLRKYVENGLEVDDSTFLDGLGGTAIFLNGAIGGLMTTSPRLEVKSLNGDTSYLEPTYDKTRAQGQHLAKSVLEMSKQMSDTLTEGTLQIAARSVTLPMDNKLFRLGAWVGVLDRGLNGWFTMRSEVAYWQLGDIGFLHVPGEIYPEIINGGIESPNGQDFNIEPVEIPPLRELLPSSHNLVVGLSNDMIGYIIPKSEWDQEPPYLYDDHDSPYGEINSLGSETGPILHTEISRMIRDFQSASSK